MQNQPQTVAVLMGGDSSERPVSFSSGRAVADALSDAGFSVTCFDVSSQGARGDISRADAMGRRPRHAIFPLAWDHLVTALYTNGFSAIFPVLHGGRGEDGTLQTLLEVAQLPYVGSGARACAIAIDKPLAKAYLREFGVQSPRGQFVSSVEEWDDSIEIPCAVKPASGGSSVGTSILREGTSADIKTAIARALSDGSGALVEELIQGTEVTCAVMGEGEAARALPVIEIVPRKGGGFYDFEAKYSAGGSEHLIPPRLSAEIQAQIGAQSLRVHRALNCRGVTRTDWICNDAGLWFLEINTTPGMTETSLVPDAARATGVEFPELVAQLVRAIAPKIS